MHDCAGAWALCSQCVRRWTTDRFFNARALKGLLHASEGMQRMLNAEVSWGWRFAKAAVLGFLLIAHPAHAEKNSDRADWMRAARFGVMTHFLHDWIMQDQRDQMTPENWNKLVAGFKVDAVADQLKSVGAAYYLL